MFGRHRRIIGLLAIAVVAVLVATSLAAWQPWSRPSRPSATEAGIASATPSPAATTTLVTPAQSPSAASTRTPTAEPTSGLPSVLIGAGDICVTYNLAGAKATAAILGANPDAAIFTAGDNSNQSGSAADYRDCVARAWGVYKDRTHPVPGNHDYITGGAAPYYAFYGTRAGPAGKGYYSYDLANDWHVIGLNAQCGYVRCGKGSAQEQWLKADLAASAGKHIIAIWHQPEFSSGGHGNTTTYITWWRDLYAAHAEIVINGHDHDYERFARQSPDGKADSNGIREFVVGTGGASWRPTVTVRANSEMRHFGTYGVLKLTLLRDSYSWQFIPVAGGTFSDSGETATHS